MVRDKIARVIISLSVCASVQLPPALCSTACDSNKGAEVVLGKRFFFTSSLLEKCPSFVLSRPLGIWGGEAFVKPRRMDK